LIKNSQSFWKKFQKTAGGIFLTHTVQFFLEDFFFCAPCICVENFLENLQVKNFEKLVYINLAKVTKH